jgi:Major Facilitator Superfamily
MFNLPQSLIADGVSFSFGLIYTELLSYFKASTAATAWVGSLFMAVPLLVGPIMSNLVDKYGCRKMTILGGILSCSGFVGASMSNSIGMLYLTFGIIAGLGLGIGYVTCVVSIAFWFDKRRTFATGIGASGTGLGTFIYAPLTQYLIETFGWRGATLILAGTLLNMCVCGSLMRDPDWLIEENQLESRSQSIQTFSNSSVCLDEIKELLKTGAKKEDLLDTLVTNVNTEANQQIALPDDIRVAKKYQSEVLLPTYIKDNQRDIDQNDSLRYCSRRSLRPDKVKSPDETLSREDFKQQIAGDKDKWSDTGNKSARLASSETLNTMEKVSDLSETLTFDAFDDEMTHRATSTESMDDGYMTGRQDPLNYQSWHGSRFSLDENLIGQNKSILSLKNEHRRSNRGNSLDVVYENEIFNPNVETLLHVGAGFPSSKPTSQDHVHDFSIAVPPRPLAVNRHRRRKRPPIIQQNGNLKRNISLRYSNYFRNMRVHRNSIHYRGAMLNTHRYRLRASSCPNIYRNSMTTIAKENEDVGEHRFITVVLNKLLIIICRNGMTTLLTSSSQCLTFHCSWSLSSL